MSLHPHDPVIKNIGLGYDAGKQVILVDHRMALVFGPAAEEVLLDQTRDRGGCGDGADSGTPPPRDHSRSPRRER